jgi:hypothetical protein
MLGRGSVRSVSFDLLVLLVSHEKSHLRTGLGTGEITEPILFMRHEPSIIEALLRILREHVPNFA